MTQLTDAGKLADSRPDHPMPSSPTVLEAAGEASVAEPPLPLGLSTLPARLLERHPTASPAMVQRSIEDAVRAFSDVRVRLYLPILIERSASEALRRGLSPDRRSWGTGDGPLSAGGAAPSDSSPPSTYRAIHRMRPARDLLDEGAQDVNAQQLANDMGRHDGLHDEAGALRWP